MKFTGESDFEAAGAGDLSTQSQHRHVKTATSSRENLVNTRLKQRIATAIVASRRQLRRPALAVSVEQLESRKMLAFDPSPESQEMLENVNRRRLNPQAEQAILFTSINPLTASTLMPMLRFTISTIRRLLKSRLTSRLSKPSHRLREMKAFP